MPSSLLPTCWRTRKEVLQLNNLRYWTDREDAVLREHYRGENRCQATVDALAVLTGRTPISIKGRIATLRLAERHRNWTQKELNYLNDNYGLVPAAEIAKRLGRSTNALKIISIRRLGGHNQRANLYTARAVALEMGVS